jgi:hypothetical protein
MDSSIKLSKKEFSKTVFARLTSSLAEFNLKDKKLERRLKKVSKELAKDIVKKSEKEVEVKPVLEVVEKKKKKEKVAVS